MRRLLLILGFVLVSSGVLMVSAGLAKGPAGKITLSGPGLEGEVEINDRAVLDPLSLAALEDFRLGAIEAPDVPKGSGYTLVRYYGSEQEYHPFDRVVYYLGTKGQPGYVYYDGILGGSSEYDGKWFRATESGDQAMRAQLVELKAIPRPGDQSSTVRWAALAGLLVLAAAAGIRRTRMRPK